MVYDVIWYGMVWYWYLLKLDFHSVAVIAMDLYKNRKETTQKEKEYIKQYTNDTENRMHKIENKKYKTKKKRKKNI